jgi:hypothetical protein
LTDTTAPVTKTAAHQVACVYGTCRAFCCVFASCLLLLVLLLLLGLQRVP